MPRDLTAVLNTMLAGRYVIDREIGAGGSARVYHARDARGGVVALKVLHPELLVSSEADRFLREIQVAGQLRHPNIAALLDSASVDWVLYYAMAFVEGPTLRELLDTRGALPAGEVIAIARDLMGALQHAHEKSIVHRDVKPENVVISPSAGAVLLDFGIARALAAVETSRLTGVGVAIGTCTYMSPEQVTGNRELDHRSDLYSLGCVLYECATGAPPFVADRPGMVMRMQLQERPVPLRTIRPELSPALERAIMGALPKDPGERWQSAAAMLTVLSG